MQAKVTKGHLERGNNRKEGELDASNPFCQSQGTKENRGPGLSQTPDAVDIAQVFSP